MICNPPGRLAGDFLLMPGGKKQSSQGCGPQTCELLMLFCKSGI